MVTKDMQVRILKEGKHLGKVGRVIQISETDQRFSVCFGGRGRPTFFTEADVATNWGTLARVESSE